MNILILSVGTKCQLVKYFKDRNNGFKRVIVTDCSRYAPALYIADKYYISPRIDDSDYLEYINEICLNEKILKLIEKLTKVIRFKGAIDIDILEDNGEYFILEINPRFGGGYPHAYECGVNFIKYLSNNAAKLVNNPESGNYMEGKILLKYTESMLLDEKDML